MIDIHIEQDVKDFLKEVQERVKGDFKVYLGGGYLRDSYKGRPIKDVDIFFVPLHDNANTVGYVPSKSYVMYNNLVEDFTEASDMARRGVKQVLGMMIKGLSTEEVQFIVYEKYLTAQEVAQDFDMNIAQIVYDVVTEEITASEEFIRGHKVGYIQCLREYSLKRTYDRYQRMQTKYPEYAVIGKPLFEDAYDQLLNVEDCIGDSRSSTSASRSNPASGSMM